MNMTEISKELNVSNAVLKTVVDKHHMAKLTDEEINILRETFGEEDTLIEDVVEVIEDVVELVKDVVDVIERTPLQRLMFG